MKNIFDKISKLFLISILLFSIKSYAAVLENVNVSVDKTNIKPGEEVKVTIDFGESLGEYTVNIFYDNKIFDYQSVEGGSAVDNSDKIVITNNEEPKSSISATFKAKEELTTTNPTEFIVSGDNLKDSNLNNGFDNFSNKIENVVVEPEYIDYTLNIESTGDIIAGEQNEMKISFSSPLGKHYSKARLIASVVAPDDAIVTLIGMDIDNIEYEIIESGWGDPQGFGIGGKDYSQILSVIGKFSVPGDYVITLSLIDRQDADAVIVQKDFTFTVIEATTDSDENGADVDESNSDDTNTETPNGTVESDERTLNEDATDIPEKLPKTGINIFIPSLIAVFSILGLIVYYNQK